jgi:hypothetical protein
VIGHVIVNIDGLEIIVNLVEGSSVMTPNALVSVFKATSEES